MAVHALHRFFEHMGFMGEFDVVERNGSLFDSDMAEGGAGHLCSEFLWTIIPVEAGHGLLRLMVRRIEEFNRILNIVGAPSEGDEVLIVTSLIQEVLGLFKLRRPRPIHFRFPETSR